MVRNMAATDRGMKVPEFESEAQEARWWDEHKDLVERKLIEAMRNGTAQRGTAQRLLRESRASKNITIRMPLADLERARQLSARKGLGYQTYIKMLLHEALDREETRPVL
jgi:predicted DNA binding CopG/RHH family protein